MRKHRTRNLEIPGLVLTHHPGMTESGLLRRFAPRNDEKDSGLDRVRLRLYLDHDFSGRQLLALRDVDGGDRARDRRGVDVLHFHGFQRHYRLAGRNALARLDQDRNDAAAHRRANLAVAAPPPPRHGGALASVTYNSNAASAASEAASLRGASRSSRYLPMKAVVASPDAKAGCRRHAARNA